MEDTISTIDSNFDWLGKVVAIKAFDDVPEHKFKITVIWRTDDVLEFGGFALDGPLEGAYGEPELTQIKGY